MTELLALLGWSLGVAALLLFMWDMYVAYMHVDKLEGELGPIAALYGKSLKVRAGLLDAALNLTLFTAIFLDLPREWTITHRLKRYRLDPRYAGTWRSRLAGWVCEHAINPFSPNHC